MKLGFGEEEIVANAETGRERGRITCVGMPLTILSLARLVEPASPPSHGIHIHIHTACRFHLQQKGYFERWIVVSREQIGLVGLADPTPRLDLLPSHLSLRRVPIRRGRLFSPSDPRSYARSLLFPSSRGISPFSAMSLRTFSAVFIASTPAGTPQ